MNTCKTCRHFSPDTFPRPNGEHFDECTHPKLNPNGLHDGADGLMPKDGLLSMDSFWVGPDFGCIHHEPPNGQIIVTTLVDVKKGDAVFFGRDPANSNMIVRAISPAS